MLEKLQMRIVLVAEHHECVQADFSTVLYGNNSHTTQCFVHAVLRDLLALDTICSGAFNHEIIRYFGVVADFCEVEDLHTAAKLLPPVLEGFNHEDVDGEYRSGFELVPQKCRFIGWSHIRQPEMPALVTEINAYTLCSDVKHLTFTLGIPVEDIARLPQTVDFKRLPDRK